MTQEAARPTPLEALAHAQHIMRRRMSARIAEVEVAIGPRIGRLLGPRQAARAVFDLATYRIVLALGTLFLVSVSVWFALELIDYTPVGSDDVRITMFTNEILNNPGALTSDSVVIQRQLPLVQYITYVSAVSLFGWDFPLVTVPFVFSLALAVAVGYAAYKATGSSWAALIAVLLLYSLEIFSIQARSLPLYPGVLFLGYGGLVASIIYVRSGSRLALGGAAAGLVAALYTYNIGVLFLTIPILYLLVDRRRTTVMRLGGLYAVLVASAIPFTVWHLAVGGADTFFGQDLRWMITEGYLELRNLNLFSTGSASPSEFLEKLTDMFNRAAGPLVLPLLAFAILGVTRLPCWAWRGAVLLAIAIPLAALIYKSPADHARYVYILLPGLVILAVYGLISLIDVLRSYKHVVYVLPFVGVLLMAGLGVTTVRNVQAEAARTYDLTNASKQDNLARIAKIADDGRAVLGTRAWTLVTYSRGSELLGPGSVTEKEFVTYLSWPSEKAIKRLFKRNDVGWVLLQKPVKAREVRHHLWLREITGKLPRHVKKLKTSKLVKRVHENNGYILYKVIAEN